MTTATAIKKILVIKLRHLGDVLLTTPVFQTLKKEFPDAQIHAYIYSESLPMLEGHPAISNFHLCDKRWKKLPLLKRFIKEVFLLLAIRRQKYDIVFNLTEGDRGALAAIFSGAKLRIGFDPEGSGFWSKSKVFTHLVKNCKTPRHAVERNLDALRCIGIVPTAKEKRLNFFIPIEAGEKTKKFSDFIVIHPVSRWRFKSPHASLFAELVKRLRKRGEKILLTAGPDFSEKKFIDEIISLSGSENLLSLAGELSLKELGALFAKAKALITVDSVSLHLASALQTPVIALFGPTSEKNWGPWHHSKALVVAQSFPCRPCHLDGCGGSKKSDCLNTLSVEQILKAYDRLFSIEEASSDLALKALPTPTTE